MWLFPVIDMDIPVTGHVSCWYAMCGFPLLIWIFPILDMIWIFPLLDMTAVDMRCVELSATWIQATGATSRIPHLLFPFPGILFMISCSCYIVPDSRDIVLCYQQSSGPVIMLPVPCTVIVLVTLYTWHITYQIIKITWVWGRLDGWLDLIGWMYWIHIEVPLQGTG